MSSKPAKASSSKASSKEADQGFTEEWYKEQIKLLEADIDRKEKIIVHLESLTKKKQKTVSKDLQTQLNAVFEELGNGKGDAVKVAVTKTKSGHSVKLSPCSVTQKAANSGTTFTSIECQAENEGENTTFVLATPAKSAKSKFTDEEYDETMETVVNEILAMFTNVEQTDVTPKQTKKK